MRTLQNPKRMIAHGYLESMLVTRTTVRRAVFPTARDFSFVFTAMVWHLFIVMLRHQKFQTATLRSARFHF